MRLDQLPLGLQGPLPPSLGGGALLSCLSLSSFKRPYSSLSSRMSLLSNLRSLVASLSRQESLAGGGLSSLAGGGRSSLGGPLSRHPPLSSRGGPLSRSSLLSSLK